jgi:DNA-binding NtrC family response regulator
MVDPVETLVPDSADARPVVLVVEDEFLLRWPASEFLRDCGYRVIEAASVSEAIAVLSSNSRVDMVFSDVNLQGGPTGHALSVWLDEHQPGLPLILTSGDKTAAAAITADGRRTFIPKPYALTDVDQRIREILRSRD